MRQNTTEISPTRCWPLLTLALLAFPLGVAAQSGDTAAEPGEDDSPLVWSFDAERSSHIVRDGEDRLLFGWRSGRWQAEALYSTLSPPFRDERDRLGIGVGYEFDRQRLRVVLRSTDRTVGDDDLLASVRWTLTEFGGGELSTELTFSNTDLTAEGFLVGGDDQQLYGQAEWHGPNGWSASVFAADRGTFDMTRDTDELLQRLPRSKIVGAETLADRYIDEDRAQDYIGLSVGKDGQRHSWRTFFKSGEQLLRGIETPEDLTGFGGEYRFRGEASRVDTEVQINQLEFGNTSLERARVLIDLRQRFGTWNVGLGSYAEGENETLSDLLDNYSTAGVGLTLSKLTASGEWGSWAMLEDDAADFQKIARLAAFYRRDKIEYGLGIRADEFGRDNFQEEDLGPFLYTRRPVNNRWWLDLHAGSINSEGYGRLLLTARR